MNFFDYIKNNNLMLFIASLILNVILIVVIVFLLMNSNNCDRNINEEKTYLATETEKINEALFVEIKGAVKKPGVYEVNDSNIINDVVKKAGGFTSKAYTKNINLSRKISNELVIYVYTENEYKKLTKKSETINQEKCECSTYIIDNCISNGTSEIVSSDKDTSFVEENKSESAKEDNNLVNINTASIEELTTLNGIGESRAKDIIEYRTNNGAFKNIEDIKNVSGIGDSLFEKIRENITV